MNYLKYIAILLGILFLITNCTHNKVAGGGGVETGNPDVVGRVSISDNLYASGAVIKLRPRDYLRSNTLDSLDSLQIIDLVANDSGVFEIANLPNGQYILDIKFDDSLGSIESFTKTDEKVDLDQIELGPLTSISGSIGGVDLIASEIIVQIPGLDRIEYLDTADYTFEFENIPVGNYEVQVISVDSHTVPAKIPLVVEDVLQEEHIGTIEIQPTYADWKKSLKILVNTGKSGVNISEPLYNYPLLIRLNADNFDFETAQVNGADIRFSNRWNEPLTYEFDRWDVANKKADIWISVDTLFPKEGEQYIMLYWGSNYVNPLTFSETVFDTAYGFSGVWHLSEEIADTANKNVYQNSAEDDLHGDDYIISQNQNEFIGINHHFGGEDYIQVDSGAAKIQSQTGTLSAWVKVDGGGTDEIISLGDDIGMRISGGVLHLFFFNVVGNGKDSTVRIIRGGLINPGEWTYVAGTFTESELSLYQNGRLVAYLYDTTAVKFDHGPHLRIGIHGTLTVYGNEKFHFSFNGNMDEIRVSIIPRNEDWIKMNYETQLLDPNIIQFISN